MGVHTAFPTVEELIETLTFVVGAGVAALDREFRFVAVNDKLTAMDHTARKDHHQKSVFSVFPEFQGILGPELNKVLSTSVPARGIFIDQTEGFRSWRADLYPCPMFLQDTAKLLLIVWDFADNATCGIAPYQSCSVHCTIAAGVRLTHRERQILELVGQGRTSKEIATTLNIMDGTVGEHRKNLCRKLNLHSTCELAACGARRLAGLCPHG
jgi:DNA-binding CsgD family transcriptional regulator